MNNYVYVPGLSESVEAELKKEELKKEENPDKRVSKTGAKKKYAPTKDGDKLRNCLVDDRDIRIPFWEKYALTVKEASEYYNIPETRLKSFLLSNREASFTLKAGARLLVKRRLFELYLDENGEI